MAGPYQALAYFAEKEKGEATRRAIAQQFMEFRRLNPEATADDMRQFLSMSGGGSPYVPNQLQSGQYIDRIAKQNGETKAKRLLEEEHKKVLQQAKERETLGGIFMEGLSATGGDKAKAREYVASRFGGDPYFQDLYKQSVDENGLYGKWERDTLESKMPGIQTAITSGQGVEAANALLPNSLWNHPLVKGFHGQWQEAETRRKEEDAFKQGERERTETERLKAEEATNRTTAATIVQQKMPYELAVTAFGQNVVDKAMPLVRQLQAQTSTLTYESSKAAVRKRALDAGETQAGALNLKVLTGKGGPYEKTPWIAQAAKDITANYALTPQQLGRLHQTLQAGVKGGSYEEAKAALWAATTEKGVDVPTKLLDYFETQALESYERNRPANFQQALANQDADVSQDYKVLTNVLATALQSPRDEDVLKGLNKVSEDARLNARIVTEAFLSVRSSEWGDSTYDERLTRAAAERWVAQFEQLADRAEAEAAKRGAPRVGKPKPKIAPRAAAPRALAPGERDWGQPGWKIAKDLAENPGEVTDWGQPGWKTMQQLLTKPE